MKLIIFDLDQTLVDFISVHDAVTRKLFKEFFGVEAKLTDIDFAGKNLTESLHQLAQVKNIPDELFWSKAEGLIESYESTFGASLPRDTAKHILPGVRELLTELSRTDSIVALYTGSPRGIVDRILSATSLGNFFRFCQYGTEVKTRAEMVKLAIEKAERLTGRKFSGKDIVIIGDSTRDIECGKLFNALTIAVATGFHSAEALARLTPDYLFKDLRDYEEVLAAIGGSSA